MDQAACCEHVRRALAEDIGQGDATSNALIPSDALSNGLIVSRQPLTVAGLPLAQTAFHEICPKLKITSLSMDGDTLESGKPLMQVEGATRAILSSERTALNYLQRLSGIATLTNRFFQEIAGTKARLLDTRKTTPGWRMLEKYAVARGGGHNHRMGLHDMVLIKDNHLAALHNEPNPIATAINRARNEHPKLKIEIEADTPEQALAAIEAGADIVLLDNMKPDVIRKIVRANGRRSRLEASGGVTLDNIRGIAETGVDFISVGALTHSAAAVDIALDFQ
ncbi:MAG: nicotinate-nucleotide diphosphorylase (carboxylating) [Verrucomicrobiales bacterium]|nr:nicotinate-nucleotide diphosphorylase (carboxylating) [Verrucomicrobiales bacterium]